MGNFLATPGGILGQGGVSSQTRGFIPAKGQVPTVPRESHEALSLSMFNQVNKENVGVSAWEQAARFTAAVPLDIADTMWSSPINPVGWVTGSNDRGSVWELAPADQKRFYERNQPAIEGTSAIVGGIATAVAAEAIVVPRIAGALASSTSVTASRAWQAGAKWNKDSLRNMQVAQLRAIDEGVDWGLWSSREGINFLANRATATAAATTRTLPIDYAVMWNNEAFNSGELGYEAMWIGLGGSVGALAGVVRARGVARQFTNAPEARSHVAQRTAMAGTTNALLGTSTLGRIPRQDHAGFNLFLKDSTEASLFMNMSRSQLEGGIEAGARNIEMSNQMRAGARKQAQDVFGKILTRGVQGVNVDRTVRSSDPEIQHVLGHVAKSDPNTIFGLSSLGIPKGSFRAAIKERDEFIKASFMKSQSVPGFAATDKQMQDAADAAILRKQQPFAMLDGAWYSPDSPLVEAARMHDPKAIRAGTKIERDTAVIPMPHKQASDVRLDITLKPRSGKSLTNVARMDWRDRFALFEGANKMLGKLLEKKGVDKTAKGAGFTSLKIKDKESTSWFALDMANELIERGGGNRIVFDSDNVRLTSQEDIQRHSLRLKARELLKEKGPTGSITPEDRLRYNLPAPTSVENWDDLDGDGFRQWLNMAASAEGTVDELSQGLSSMRAIEGFELLDNGQLRRPSIHGRAFEFNRTIGAEGRQNGEWMRPMLGYFDPKQAMGGKLREAMEERIMVETGAQLAVLRNTKASPHIGTAATMLSDSNAMKQAMAVNELTNVQSTGLGGRVRQAVSEFLPKRSLHRDNAVVQAAFRLQDMTDTLARQAYTSMVESHGLSDLVTKLSSRAGVGLRAELDQYASLRPGYDILEETTIDGRVAFVLDDTDVNRRLLGVDKVKKGTLLRNQQTGDAITLSPEASGIVSRFNSLTDELHQGTNQVRRANGQAPIGRKAYFMPSTDTRGKMVGFLRGPDGELVPGAAVVAATPQEYKRETARMLAEYGDGYSVASKEQMKAIRDVTDIEAMDWVDHGYTQLNRTGGQSGGLNPLFTRDGAFLDALDWASNTVRTQHADTLKTMMKMPLQTARMRSAATRTVDGQAVVGKNVGEGMQAPTRNIYDEYENALLGSSQAYNETQILSKASKGFEALLDNVAMLPLNHLLDMAKRFNYDANKLKKAKTYDQILSQLGEHSPYKSADDWVQSQGVRKPADVRKVSQKMNKIATDVILRWDPFMAHASMNMLGLIPTLLAGAKAGSAPSTLAMNVKGKNIEFVDSLRLIKQAIGDMTPSKKNTKARADFLEMVRNGDANQSAYEYHQQLGAISNKADWHKFADQADSVLAWASDRSENMSRQLSHFVGLRVADAQGIRGMQARHDFAREFANASIADYAPSNRPELYQTSLGSVFGLFQSYAMGQFTKMFHWMEEGEYAAFGIQAATQASLFGVAGTYGASSIFAAHDMFFDESGEPSLMDTLYARFGPTLGNAMAHGGIAELTQVALWTRGDMQPRMPIMSGMAPPGVDVLRRAANMTVGTAKQFLTNLPQDAVGPALEIIQREMPNRVLKGTLAAIHGGVETDRNGNVITQSDNWLESVARIAGVRSSRQQLEMDAFYANKSDMDRDAIRKRAIRMDLKSAFRAASRGGEPVNPLDYFDKYLEAGGNPGTFKTWIKNVMRDSVNTRAAAELRSSMATPQKRLQAWRYPAYGAWDLE